MTGDTQALVEVAELCKWFAQPRRSLTHRAETIRAVTDVSFAIRRGEVLGLVGESGSGKSTIGRTILRLWEPTSGTIRFDGQDITRLSRRQLKPLRRRMQLVFQDPFGSLNPRMTVEAILATPLIIHEARLSAGERRERIAAALAKVGLARHYAGRFPHEFSGGQRQRIGIARALMVEPRFLVADEPVSMLDVSVRAGILDLLDGLRRGGLGILMITHDLSTATQYADRILVMYLGRIVEEGPARTVVGNPQHPYTQALISVVPRRDPHDQHKPQILQGETPNPVDIPAGCRFHPRCPIGDDACRAVDPQLAPAAGHRAACIKL